MIIPVIGDKIPKRGNRLSKAIGRGLLWSCRWRIEGSMRNAPKTVFVMGPHTSWWDFTVNLGVLMAMGFHASFFIANKYTKGPLGRVLAFIGAVPVERSARTDMVAQMANEFERREHFLLAIFPEGTRKPVGKWKSGFWHIAKQAGVPVQLVAVDYVKRATVFGPIIDLSDNKEKDIEQMREFFKPGMAKKPQQAVYAD